MTRGVLEDLSGRRFGALVALSHAGKRPSGKQFVTMWNCQCDCGALCEVRASNLKSGQRTSCGCYIGRPSKRREDLVGERFGSYTAVRLAEQEECNGAKQAYWLCRCDCGEQRVVRRTALTSGMSSSCGCLQRKRMRTYQANRRGKREPYVQVVMSLFRSYKTQAKQRGLSFELSLEDFLALCILPCTYCGLIDLRHTGSTEARCNGVDRVDNSLGYQESNVVPCCGVCNRNRGGMSQREFIDWIYRVANRIEGLALARLP